MFRVRRFETRASLRVLQILAQRMAVMAGDRTIVLVSPGFHLLIEHHPDENHRDRPGAAIQCCDQRAGCPGLFEINPAGELDDRPQQFDIEKGLDVMKRMQEARYHSRRADAETSASVMADLASRTGGRLIENSNDYDAALRRLAAAPEYIYMLGFSPTSLKPDGSFHPLTGPADGRIMTEGRVRPRSR